MLFLANWLNNTLTIQPGYAELAYLQEQFMHGVGLVKTATQHPLVKFTDKQQGNKADEQLVFHSLIVMDAQTI